MPSIENNCANAQKELEAEDEALRQAAEKGDVTYILSCLQTATIYPQGTPALKGAEAENYFRKIFTAESGGCRVRFAKPSDIVVSPHGDFAYSTMFEEVEISTDSPTGTTVCSRNLLIWRRDQNNRWRVAVNIWNFDGELLPGTSLTGA